MEPIVDTVTAFVTRFPGLAEPLTYFMQTLAALVDEPPAMTDAEDQVVAAADRLARSGVGEVLLAHQPEADVVEVDGRRFRRMATATHGVYFSLRGAVHIERHLYREIGVHNGPTLVPLELRAGLVDGLWTPLAAAATAHLLQDEPSRDAVETCLALHVMPYSRSALERGGDSVGGRWEEIRVEAEDKLAADFVIPNDATSLSVSVDRVSMPMEEPLLDEDGAAIVDADGKARVHVPYRMAYCAVWTLHDADGEPLHSVRYGRMPADGHGPIEDTLLGDLNVLVAARPDLRLVGLADGAPEMQFILDRTVGSFGDDVYIGIDFWHVVEYIAGAVTSTGRKAAEWVPGFKQLLRTDDRAAGRITTVLRSWALELSKTDQPDAEPTPLPKALTDAITYLTRNGDRMRYRHLRDAGLPIGSGQVEATCKTLVSTRMKRCGARWKTPGGQAVLSLRSLARSSRWQDAMDILLPTFVEPVRVAA